MKRTTIKDIARAAQVSPAAVSFALNDKPGVSAQTRLHQDGYQLVLHLAADFVDE